MNGLVGGVGAMGPPLNPPLVPSHTRFPRESVVLTTSRSQRRGNLGGRVGSCPLNYITGWAANVFCPPKKFSQHIRSTELPALVDSISESRSLWVTVQYQP